MKKLDSNQDKESLLKEEKRLRKENKKLISQKDKLDYVRTIDEVEEVTGIDFFFNLPDDVEETVESNSDINKW